MNNNIKLPPLSPQEYEELCHERDRINLLIAEYENEFRRGCIKVIRTKGGVKREKDVYSIRLDRRLGNDIPNWSTVDTFYTLEEVLTWMDCVCRDLPTVRDAIRNSMIEKKSDDELTKGDQE